MMKILSSTTFIIILMEVVQCISHKVFNHILLNSFLTPQKKKKQFNGKCTYVCDILCVGSCITIQFHMQNAEIEMVRTLTSIKLKNLLLHSNSYKRWVFLPHDSIYIYEQNNLYKKKSYRVKQTMTSTVAKTNEMGWNLHDFWGSA